MKLDYAHRYGQWLLSKVSMRSDALSLVQFFPEFEKECHELASSRGVAITRGFSARELFQKISTGARPFPEMIAAVKTLKEAGGVFDSYYSATFKQQYTKPNSKIALHPKSAR